MKAPVRTVKPEKGDVRVFKIVRGKHTTRLVVYDEDRREYWEHREHEERERRERAEHEARERYERCEHVRHECREHHGYDRHEFHECVERHGCEG